MRKLRKYRGELLGALILTLIFLAVSLLYEAGFLARSVPLSEHIPYVEALLRPINSSPYGIAWRERVLAVSYPSMRIIAFVDENGSLVRLLRVERGVTSLSYSGDRLLAIDSEKGTVVEVLENGSLRTLPVTGLVNPVSISCWRGMILVYDSYSMHILVYSPSGSLIKRIPVSGHLLGIAACEDGLWAVIPSNQTIALMSWGNFSVKRWIYSPTPSPYGLAWGGGRLWVTDYVGFEIDSVNPFRRVYVVVDRHPPSWLPTVYAIAMLPFILSALSKRR